MRNTIFLYFVLVPLLLSSCKEKSVPVSSSNTGISSEAFNSRKLDSLGSRYNELGRFSGSILVSEKGEIAYQEFFGKADYDTQTPFTPETTFAVDSLLELFIKVSREKSGTEGRLNEEDAVAMVAENLGLKNSAYLSGSALNAATGHTHIMGPSGPETTAIPSTREARLWATAADIQILLKELTEQSLQQDGYLEKDGFSYAVRKHGDLIVIVLSNRRHPVAGEMAHSIEKLWQRKPYQLPLPRKEINVPASLLDEYAGFYELGAGTDLRVISQNDSLFVLMGPQKVHLKPQSENQFFLEQADSAIRFKKDSLNKVVIAELLDGFLSGHEIPKRL